MIQAFIAGQMLKFGHRIRSRAANERQFRAAATAIADLVTTAPEPVLRGWPAYMTINHCKGVQEAMLGLIPELGAGRSPEIVDIGRFDHPGECGPEVMPRFCEPAARVSSLQQSYPSTGRGTLRHPIFGRIDSRGAFALLAFHPWLHVPTSARASRSTPARERRSSVSATPTRSSAHGGRPRITARSPLRP